MDHEGRATYRLRQNPMEKKYHDAWKRENESGDLLAWLMGDGANKGAVTERDALVAATVVQWLGSPVGKRFVAGVLGHNGWVVRREPQASVRTNEKLYVNPTGEQRCAKNLR